MDAEEAEGSATPKGRLRAGHAKVAGVATLRAKQELEGLMAKRGLRSLSQAIGVALEEWVLIRSERVQNPGEGSGTSPPPSPETVQQARRLASLIATEDIERAISDGRLYDDRVAPWFDPILRDERRIRREGGLP